MASTSKGTGRGNTNVKGEEKMRLRPEKKEDPGANLSKKNVRKQESSSSEEECSTGVNNKGTRAVTFFDSKSRFKKSGENGGSSLEISKPVSHQLIKGLEQRSTNFGQAINKLNKSGKPGDVKILTRSPQNAEQGPSFIIPKIKITRDPDDRTKKLRKKKGEQRSPRPVKTVNLVEAMWAFRGFTQLALDGHMGYFVKKSAESNYQF